MLARWRRLLWVAGLTLLAAPWVLAALYFVGRASEVVARAQPADPVTVYAQVPGSSASAGGGGGFLAVEAAGPGAGAASAPPTRRQQLAVELAQAEAQADALAQEYRYSTQNGPFGADVRDPQQIRSELVEAVNRAFDLRQQVQQAEVEELRQRLTSVEGRIQKRDGAKDQIVDRRVAELLDERGDLDWDPQDTRDAPGGGQSPTGRYGDPRLPGGLLPAPSVSVTPSDTPPSAGGGAAGAGVGAPSADPPSGTVVEIDAVPTRVPSSAGAAPDGASTLNPADGDAWADLLIANDGRTLLMEFSDAVTQYEELQATMTSNPALIDPQHGQQELARLERRAELLRAQVEAQARVAALAVEAAALRLEVAQADWEEIREIKDAGVISASDLRAKELAFREAELALAQARAVAQLYEDFARIPTGETQPEAGAAPLNGASEPALNDTTEPAATSAAGAAPELPQP
jgi:hypothetical protein